MPTILIRVSELQKREYGAAAKGLGRNLSAWLKGLADAEVTGVEQNIRPGITAKECVERVQQRVEEVSAHIKTVGDVSPSLERVEGCKYDSRGRRYVGEGHLLNGHRQYLVVDNEGKEWSTFESPS